MENLRWILIVAGIAILVLLYVSGRSNKAERRARRETDLPTAGGSADADPLLGRDRFDADLPDFEVDADDFERPDRGVSTRSVRDLPMVDTDPTLEPTAPSSLSQKIEAFSARLSPKRRQRIARSEPADAEDGRAAAEAYATKIVTLHVVAPDGRLLQGERLLQVFEERGYHFGEMSIFHSMHEGKTVFSVAKMVEPGYFDIDEVESFHTPGISMILQLPGPVPADVAFEVFVSEAADMARALGATVLDADRSTLSPQTVQHMRDGIYEYMHRQKYFGGVPS